jgi:hypothetical protein
MSLPESHPLRLLVRDGVSQDGRALAPLRDGYFSLAGMAFPELLAMACECAALVKFHQHDGEVAGHWGEYFSADETVVLARILSARLEPHHAALHAWCDNAGDVYAADDPYWRGGQLPMAPLAELLDGWLNSLSGTGGKAAHALQPLLAGVIASLREDESGFAAFLPAPGITLGPAWRAAPGAARPAPARATRKGIRAQFFSFVKAVEMAQQEARRLLPASLESGDHDPGTALLIAFIQMAGRLGARLDRFTGRHIDFFQRSMLGAAPLPATPDLAYLVAAPAAPGLSVAIPAGTQFVARPDPAAPELVYRAEAGLLVTDARVRALHTLCFNLDPHVSPEADVNRGQAPRRPWPAQAWFDSLPVTAAPVTDTALLRAAPLLGAPKGAARSGRAGDARLGFAFASSVLLLEQGTRRVSITLGFASDRLGKRLSQLDAAVRAAGNIEQEDLFLKVFRTLFKISLTGPEGWFEVSDYFPSRPAGSERTLRLDFTLPLDAPPVVAHRAALHGADFGAALAVPVVRLVLDPRSYVYPYGLLRDLVLADAAIEVEVSGYRQLSLQNQIGPLSPAIPFQPFGPLPEVGSYLIVGAGEAAAKSLSAFDLELEWAGLPVESGGFGAYYHDYVSSVDTEDYLARIEVLADGAWQPPEERAPLVPLFRTDVARTASKRVLKRIRLSCDGVIGRASPASAGEAPGYSAASRNGYVKFTLASPRFAFGHREYPHALGYALKRGLRDKSGRFHASVPELPYTPVVDAITAHYVAGARIDLHQGAARGEADHAMFHLHPLGWEAVGAGNAARPTLLPGYPELGHLYIGVQASALEDVLTLFFHLRDDALPGQPKPVCWSYLSGNRWKSLRERDLISDSTDGFMTSGAVAVRIPRDIGCESTVMPDGLYWLRISAVEGLRDFASLYAVHAHVLRVVREDGAAGPTMLPAGSIRRSRTVIAGLGKLTQVIDSVGGRPAESPDRMRTRVAERVRHKGRAVTPADYETLVLERFPQVWKVKCFANLCMEGSSPRDWVRPGRVLVVPLPYLGSGDAFGRMPQLNPGLLREIEAELAAVASPSVRVTVAPPVYEQIQVRCNVRLREGLAGGAWVERLNADISRFLSPWNDDGSRVHFGWRLRLHDVESRIGALDYVAEVLSCSLLLVTPAAGADQYRLSDTARGAAGTVDAAYPWSVAVPIDRHMVAVGDRRTGPRQASLSTLGIGSTFIIAKEQQDGPAKP